MQHEHLQLADRGFVSTKCGLWPKSQNKLNMCQSHSLAPRQASM